MMDTAFFMVEHPGGGSMFSLCVCPIRVLVLMFDNGIKDICALPGSNTRPDPGDSRDCDRR